MKEMIWVAPDGHRYTVALIQEPGDRMQTLVFRRDWTGTAPIAPDLTLMELWKDDLWAAFAHARGGEGDEE